ncbi:hypothetical protein N180_11610 [Pedobacter antarcticus 4BY]|uniref:Uncharacterized protein n=2 Tax=Pedobacter antarcticus TaxID=34086 RepID=A0A081PM40_9SPHI|nr:hypothetical protein N180_11610 [Pedobacter antarcticus 4BY]SFF34711.1 hypothetical protein SAMN03003324_03419 [Pedobacter antarcticus]
MDSIGLISDRSYDVYRNSSINLLVCHTFFYLLHYFLIILWIERQLFNPVNNIIFGIKRLIWVKFTQKMPERKLYYSRRQGKIDESPELSLKLLKKLYLVIYNQMDTSKSTLVTIASIKI